MTTLAQRRYQVQYDDGIDNVVVMDGVPVIDRSKADKLLARIAKEFTKKGSQVKVDDMFIPWDEKTGKSKGYAQSLLLHVFCMLIYNF